MPGYAVFAVDALEAEEDAGKTILSSLPFIKVEYMPAGELPRNFSAAEAGFIIMIGGYSPS